MPIHIVGYDGINRHKICYTASGRAIQEESPDFMNGVPRTPDSVSPPPDRALTRLRRSFEQFCTLPDSVWDDVRQAWVQCNVSRGEVLTDEGETERGFLLVLEGVHRVFFTARDGNEHTVAFSYPTDYSGIPDSFFLQVPSGYRLEPLSDSSVLATDYDTLSALMDRHRELERWAWRLLASALRGRSKRERDHMRLTAEERYERLLEESPQLVQRVPLKHIASYLGMSPETLSRIRSSNS
ncbi:MAG: Crp/Fnr family transcriptional regulator [Bacteroidetes bacterium QH_2_64_74]|nr:MAG: Crp/Fnr family transcriptional regulator [Bacteroidetes bacterium QH_2_64_74]